MMKKKLKKQPLVYTVIQLRFSEIPVLNSVSEATLKTLHENMIAEGFQEKIESNTTILNLHLNVDTKQATQQETLNHRVLFRASGEKQIVSIAKDSITINSTEYSTFEEFLDTFRRVITACVGAVDGIKDSLLKSVGIRYIDVIVPDGNKRLSDYVDRFVLPAPLEFLKGKHLHGVTSKVIETGDGQVLVVRFEELASLDKKVTKVLPDELLEPDRNCTLKIDGQEGWLDVVSPTYGILDIDHTYNFKGSPLFNENEIWTAIGRLYEQSSSVFWNVITSEAEKAWGKE